ncbi:MAG: response regulator [Bacteroidota bacterium]
MIDPTFKNANILIVDDQQPNIDILTGLLEFQGYTSVMHTTDPRQVVSLFKSFNPDLILLDLMMPHLNGYEVLEQLKELIPSDTYLPVLVLTADITVEAKQRALSGGAKDFLAKPFDLIEVGMRIQNLLFARHLHLQVKSQNTQLQAANRELESFSYSVSHDLRAPLRHIRGFIDILIEMKNSQRSEEELQYMQIISNGATEMGKLIEALLSFSRLQRAAIRKRPINTLVMVQHIITFFEPETKNRNISFKIGQMLECNADEQLIKQVWINLISNAIKYTGKKAEAIIEIGSARQDNETMFYVKDNGAGFDMKNAEKLFTVFQRLHKPSDFEGIGIGLANVNNIVIRHGGRCRAEGETGGGATFYFYLPN